MILKLLPSRFLVLSDLLSVQIQLTVIQSTDFRWVRHAQIRVQLVVNKPQKGHIELSECSDHFIVYVEWQSLVKSVWLDPSDLLSHQLNLRIDTLNTKECLPNTLGNRAVGHPLLV